MTPRVELVYFSGCPHAEEARSRLRLALEVSGLTPTWDEWDTGRRGTPDSYLRFGSPTVLVNGRDVSGGMEGIGMGCVVAGAPPVAIIVNALQGGRE